MRTDAAGNLIIKAPSSEQQENIKNTRRTLKVLQQAATDKENLVGRAQRPGKEILTKSQSENSETVEKRKKIAVSHKYVQTGNGLKIDVSDLTSEAGPSENYWEAIAERRRVALDESLDENRKLHEENDALREENRLVKEMLDESKSLVEVLSEMLGENDTSVTDQNDEKEPDDKDDNNEESAEKTDEIEPKGE